MSALIRVSIVVTALLAAAAAQAQTPKPAAQYLMSVSTDSMAVPGMAGAGGGLEGMVGSMAMGGMGMGGGPQRSIWLDLLGPDTPPSPAAEHLIPPGLKMGPSLPLLTPAPGKGGTPSGEAKREDIRILFYWGCGDTIGPGQPKVLDTAKMSAEDYGQVPVSRRGSSVVRLGPRKGWTYGEWPNREKMIQVPGDGSLQGDHLIKGSYTPDIKFSLDQRRDFMEPVAFTKSEGGLADAIRLEWRSIPNATGYFMMATGGSEGKKEIVMWNCSEVQEMGGGLMNYVSPGTVQKYIKDKVVLAPSVARCTIPKGIFKGTDGAMLMFIAYGEEANFAQPPKPADPKAPWNPIWTAKVRLKSTGMIPLGMEAGDMAGGRGTEKSDVSKKKDSGKAQTEPEAADPVKDVVEGAKKIKGLFGF